MINCNNLKKKAPIVTMKLFLKKFYILLYIDLVIILQELFMKDLNVQNVYT